MEEAIFKLIVLLFSVVIHEVSHGFVAEKLGDPTARLAGRLTLNPIKHLELFGSFLLPSMLYFFSGGSFVFGWAKPVPYNPYNLKNPAKSAGLIAMAGPVSNLSIAFIFGILYRVIASTPNIHWPVSFLTLLSVIVLINVLLAIFNLVPLPPLDGSKVLFSVLPKRAQSIQIFLERYGLVFLLLFVFFGFRLIIPIVSVIFKLLIG